MELFISEVRKREVLWNKSCVNYKNRLETRRAWHSVAKITGLGKDEVRAKWKNLRDTFMRELRKIEKPDSEASGEYLPGIYTGKWEYFQHMSFLSSFYIPKAKDGNVSHQSSLTQSDTVKEEVQILPFFDEERTSPSCLVKEEVESSSEDTFNYDVTGVSQGQNDEEESFDFELPSPPPAKKAKYSKPKNTSLSEFEQQLLLMEKSKFEMLKTMEVEDEDWLFLKSILPYMKKLKDVEKLTVRNEFHNILIQKLKDK